MRLTAPSMACTIGIRLRETCDTHLRQFRGGRLLLNSPSAPGDCSPRTNERPVNCTDVTSRCEPAAGTLLA